MLVEVVDDYETMSDRAAEVIIEQIRKEPDSVIGFATGSMPKGLYNRLIETHENRRLDFSKLTTFTLDEYVDLAPPSTTRATDPCTGRQPIFCGWRRSRSPGPWVAISGDRL